MKLKLIQAGVGGMGKAWWTHAVKESPDFELAALVDIDTAALSVAAEALAIPPDRCFGDLAAALQAVKVDALVTVTPPAGPRRARYVGVQARPARAL